jgi:murein peptide amidase A
MSAVKAAPLDPPRSPTLSRRGQTKAGFRARPSARPAAAPHRPHPARTPGARPRIYLSAGIHGDEPAPPLALLSLIESGEFDGRAVWFICPMLNPAASRAASARTPRDGPEPGLPPPRVPEVRAHVALAPAPAELRPGGLRPRGLGVVRASTSTSSIPDGRPSLAEPMIAAASRVCPIDRARSSRAARPRAGSSGPRLNPLEREKWPESIYLQANHTRLSYTIESPRPGP